MTVINGSTRVPLRWNYTLPPGSNLQTTAFSIDDGTSDVIGWIFHGSGITSVFDRNDYRTRFTISLSEVATLIINKVTEREEAVYQCELSTVSNTWKYRIQVIVKGELLVRTETHFMSGKAKGAYLLKEMLNKVSKFAKIKCHYT